MDRIEHEDGVISSNSLKNRVLNRIQKDILNGRYKPGEILTETGLCTELGVGRTPVREAIRQLELEGLVQLIPNRGVVVRGISTKDIEDIYTIRMMIEGLAARWAAENIDEQELKDLKETIELEEFYTVKKDTEQLLKLDSKFHEIIFKASKSKTLLQVLRIFHKNVRRARDASFSSPGRAMKVLEEHKAIYEAISRRDGDEAEKVTTRHVKNASVECQNAYKLLLQKEGK